MNLLGRILWIILVLPLLGYIYHSFTAPKAWDGEPVDIEFEGYDPDDYESDDDYAYDDYDTDYDWE